MVDLQRFELEKKRYRRESVSLAVAVFALLVSGVATWFAVQPTFVKTSERSQTVESYLTALSKVGMNDAIGALAYAESNSPAASFANAVTDWRQASKWDPAAITIADGTVTRNDDGTFELCLPELPVPLLAADCVQIANIDFSESDELLEFTIDGILTKNLVRFGTGNELTAGGQGPVRIYLSTAVISPDGSGETIIYRMDRRRESDRMYPVTFRSALFQDDAEEPVEAISTYFPPKLGYWQSSKAIVQAPAATVFMQVCWGGIQDNRSSCDWLIGMGF